MTNGGANGEEKRVDLVFEGGGVKGIALVGAYSVLQREGYEPQNLAGASAGAIVASLVAAGYSATELHDILQSTPFKNFEDEGWEDRITLLGKPLSVIKDHGLYEGNYFHKWIGDLLAAKAVTKFGQLRVEGEENPKWQYRLQVIVSDVTHHSLLVLPRDAAVIGAKDPDELDIADAVRMSMSIPIFFEPVTRRVANEDVVLVDGGMLSNFPVWVFDSDGMPEWPTFGLKLVDPDPKQPEAGVVPDKPLKDNALKSLVNYLMSLVSTMTDAHDKLYLERDTFVRTITISNLGVKATDFDLTTERAEALYRSGQDGATQFLRTWDFEAYKKAFRSGKEQPSRREVVTSQMKDAVQTQADESTSE
jgi:NTE family protein